MSGKTDILVTGYKLEDGREVTQGSKYRNATDKGTEILTEDEFEERIKKLSGNEEFVLGQRKATLESIPEEVEVV